jgi:pyridoxal 5'-phosphate synthase pdxT subunit
MSLLRTKDWQSVAGSKQTIGILALQGGVDLHRLAFHKAGCDVVEIKKPTQLMEIDRIVIPGGESSALLKLMAPWDFIREIQRFNRPILGTCAGAILLANQVLPSQSSLQLIDMTVKRNAYGRQVDSFNAHGKVEMGLSNETIPLAFIRAPQIESVGPRADVLVTHDGKPVLVQQHNILAATFHPEMSSEMSVIDYFISL